MAAAVGIFFGHKLAIGAKNADFGIRKRLAVFQAIGKTFITAGDIAFGKQSDVGCQNHARGRGSFPAVLVAFEVQAQEAACATVPVLFQQRP